MKKTIAAVAIAGLCAYAAAAQADVIPYANPGVPNPVNYTFTAASTGDVTAYFYGSTAAYDNQLTMLVNGVATGIVGLDNHTSPYGQALSFGHVNAGDSLVFELVNVSPGGIGPWYSQTSLNSDGVNHVYSTSFSGDATIPVGTFVSFEDLPGGGDFNYNDEDFVFKNVATSVPEPGTLALLGISLLGLGIAKRRNKAG